MHRLAGTLGLLLPLFLSCRPGGGHGVRVPDAAGTLRLDKGAEAVGSATGYDASLPGYRLSGGIAQVVFTPAGSTPPTQFVLALRMSTMTPHLDSFTFASSAGTIQWSPFAGPGLLTITGPDGIRHSPEHQGEVLRYEIVGDEIRVIFGPAGLAMMTGECKISWIDWYR